MDIPLPALRSQRYRDNEHHLPKFASNHPLAIPEASWEKLKVQAPVLPPILTKHGSFILYHGVKEAKPEVEGTYQLSDYSAGIMIWIKTSLVKYYTAPQKPVLSPDLPEEKVGIIANVVFPTGIDRRDDLGKPNRFDVYYGMADNRIGVARLDLPGKLPQ